MGFVFAPMSMVPRRAIEGLSATELRIGVAMNGDVVPAIFMRRSRGGDFDSNMGCRTDLPDAVGLLADVNDYAAASDVIRNSIESGQWWLYSNGNHPPYGDWRAWQSTVEGNTDALWRLSDPDKNRAIDRGVAANVVGLLSVTRPDARSTLRMANLIEGSICILTRINMTKDTEPNVDDPNAFDSLDPTTDDINAATLMAYANERDPMPPGGWGDYGSPGNAHMTYRMPALAAFASFMYTHQAPLKVKAELVRRASVGAYLAGDDTSYAKSLEGIRGALASGSHAPLSRCIYPECVPAFVTHRPGEPNPPKPQPAQQRTPTPAPAPAPMQVPNPYPAYRGTGNPLTPYGAPAPTAPPTTHEKLPDVSRDNDGDWTNDWF